jgi:TolB protein
MDADGSHAEPLTFGGFTKHAPEWLSESNTVIYHISDLNKEIAGVYSIDVISKETKQILKGSMSTVISQYENLIAFTTLNSHGRVYLSVLSLTQDRTPKINQVANFSGSGLGGMQEWSLDSKYILFNQDCEGIYQGGFSIFSIEDRTMVNVVPCDAFNRSPHWSPDGNFIVFESDRNDNVDIWLVNVHTLALINLTLSNSNR